MNSQTKKGDQKPSGSCVSTSKFYGQKKTSTKIRFANSGINKQQVIVTVNTEFSDSEIESEGEIEDASRELDDSYFPSTSEDESPLSDEDYNDVHAASNAKSNTGAPSRPATSSDAPETTVGIADVLDVVISSSVIPPIPVGNRDSTASSANLQMRWRKRSALHTASGFYGPSLPPPPGEEMTPLEYFKHFFDDELIDHISHQTNLYSVQKVGTSVNTDHNEIEQYLGIIVMMGIVNLPRYRMYWSPETKIPSISETMSVNRYEKIKRFFHCNDNSDMLPRDDVNYDKLFKVRPVIDSVLSKCKAIPQEEKHAIDEQIIPTKCRSALRQYLPKKPNKWGIKVWARCGVSGIVYDFEVYTGKQKNQESSELGVMGNLVLRLTSGLPKNVGYKVYFDNLFSSIRLLLHLKANGIWTVATIRANRMMGADKEMMNEKELKERGRGSMDWRIDANSGLTAIRWFDNSVVQLVSTHVGSELSGTIRRWSAKDKKYIEIQRPKMVEEYNKHMGGVDLCDMLLSLYRIRLRTCKYYLHIVFYCLGISVVNGWLLYRRHCDQRSLLLKNQMDLCTFQSRIAKALLLSGKEVPKLFRRGRPSSSFLPSPSTKRGRKATNPIPGKDVRFDRHGHFPVFTSKQKRCRFCAKGYSHIACVKCNIQLCLVKSRNCFMDFHIN